MRRNAIVRLPFASEKHLEAALKALQPEALNPPTKRYKAALDREENSIIIKFKAKDTVALRAALNAYLRWIRSIKEILDFLQTSSQKIEM